MPELHEESGKGLTNLTRELLGAAMNKKIATDQHCTRNNVGHEERTLRGKLETQINTATHRMPKLR